MAERGVTGPVIDRLRETIELHRALATSRNVDKWVDRQFERIEGLLRDCLDREIEVFKTNRPPFYLAYTEARIGRRDGEPADRQLPASQLKTDR